MRITLFSSIFISCLSANPSNPMVISGEAHFHTQSDLLQITTSDRSIIEWGDFIINAGETTQFIQPDANSSVLNRVLDANPIQIYGTLKSNGQLILISPNGMLVGSQGIIDTASLIASSLDIQNSVFLAKGALHFSGQSHKPIIHHGKITGNSGDVVLLAHCIENDGAIFANSGRAACLAAGEFTLDSRLEVKPGLDLHFEMPQFSFEGESLSVASYDDNGVHTLLPRVDLKGAGSILAKDIYLLGTDVWIQDTAFVDASGPFGGGSIRIGGGFQGKEEGILNAKKTFVGINTQLSANATDQGDGGRVIVWGDLVNQFAGQISAQGGPNGGNGGMAEVSCPMHLFFQGTANLLSALGATGTLYIDPTDINISLSPTTGGVVLGPMTTIPAVASVEINNQDLKTALNLSNISISTVSGGAGTGDITVLAPLDNTSLPHWTGNTSLTLSAERNISVTADINPQGVFVGDQIVLISDLNNVGLGDVTISASVATNSGGIRVEGNNVNITGLPLAAASLLTGVGDINIVARNDVTATSVLPLGGVTVEAVDQLNILAGRDITIFGGLAAANASFIGADNQGMTVQAGRTITINGVDCVACNKDRIFSAPGPILFAAGEDLIINANNPVDPTGVSGQFSIMIYLTNPNSFMTLSALNTIHFVGGPSFDNGVFFASGAFGAQTITVGSVNLKAGGDLILCSPIYNQMSGGNTNPNTSLSILANHPFTSGEIWSASANAKLASTPLGSASGSASTLTGQVGGNGFGGFSVQNSFFDNGMGVAPRNIPAGIILRTENGPITIKAASKFLNGTDCDFVAAVTLNLTYGINPVQLLTVNGNITVDPPHDITVANSISTGGDVFMIAQNDLTINNSGSIVSGGDITLVCDNQAPTAPMIGLGGFTLAPKGSITAAGLIQIYTAVPWHNMIAGLINGAPFAPGTLFVDSSTEKWCTYYPTALPGIPYTISYKPCSVLPLVALQAAIIADEFLVDLHPYNEFPGWMERFTIGFSEPLVLQWIGLDTANNSIQGPDEVYYLRRRNLNVINHPKTWTTIAH